MCADLISGPSIQRLLLPARLPPASVAADIEYTAEAGPLYSALYGRLYTFHQIIKYTAADDLFLLPIALPGNTQHCFTHGRQPPENQHF